MASRETIDYRKSMIDKIYNMKDIANINIDYENSKIMEYAMINNCFHFALSINETLISFIRNNYGGKYTF